MPSITSAGIGSGLDVTGLVDQLVAAEGEPVRIRLDRKEAKLQTGLSALGTFKATVSDFQASLKSLRSPESFSSMNITNDNEDAILATASREAQPGEYDVQVVQLAQAQKLASAAFDSDVIPVGTGGMTIQLGRYQAETHRFTTNPEFPPVTITITQDNSSLRGIAEAINDSDAGVRASVINDGSGYRLVLSSLAEGLDNSIRITTLDDDGNHFDENGLSNFVYDLAAKQLSENEFTKQDAAKLASGVFGAAQVFTDDGQQQLNVRITNMKQTVAGQDAIIKVDGLDVIRSQNEINDVIKGLTLELQPGSEGTVSSLNVALSTEEVKESIINFVTKYNELVSLTNSLTGYDPETGVAGPLSGDAAVRGVNTQIRRVMSQSFSSVNSEYDSLISIGIDTERNGSLSVDEDRLQTAIDNNLQQVVQLFATAGSTTDPLIEYIGAEASTTPGQYDVVISQLAGHGVYTGIAQEFNPVFINEGENKIRLKIDGMLGNELELTPGEYNSAFELAAAIQESVARDTIFSSNDIRLVVKVEENKLVLKSESLGTNSVVEVVSIAPELSGYSGLVPGVSPNGRNVQGTFNNRTAVGEGNILTGEDAAEGLQLKVEGGVLGPRGNVFYSNGIAAQLDSLLVRMNESGGLFNSRTDGFNDRISDIAHQREQLASKLERSEKRYTKQFSSLDATLGKMRSTSEYLAQTLSSLPGASRPGTK
jgi:flagellar hook-associated protein 2